MSKLAYATLTLPNETRVTIEGDEYVVNQVVTQIVNMSVEYVQMTKPELKQMWGKRDQT